MKPFKATKEETMALMKEVADDIGYNWVTKYTKKPVNDAQKRRIGEALWTVFSNNNVVANTETNKAYDFGSFRMMAEMVSYVVGVGMYLDYYCSHTSALGWMVLKMTQVLRRKGYTVFEWEEVYETTN